MGLIKEPYKALERALKGIVKGLIRLIREPYKAHSEP